MPGPAEPRGGAVDDDTEDALRDAPAGCCGMLADAGTNSGADQHVVLVRSGDRAVRVGDQLQVTGRSGSAMSTLGVPRPPPMNISQVPFWSPLVQSIVVSMVPMYSPST